MKLGYQCTPDKVAASFCRSKDLAKHFAFNGELRNSEDCDIVILRFQALTLMVRGWSYKSWRKHVSIILGVCGTDRFCLI